MTDQADEVVYAAAALAMTSVFRTGSRAAADADGYAVAPWFRAAVDAAYELGVAEGRRRDAAQLVGLADRLDDECAGHGVASAISPGLRNAADVLTGESWLLKRATDNQPTT